MNDTAKDRQAMVDVFRLAGEPMDAFEAIHRLNPPPQNRDGRTREHKAWVRRDLDLHGTLVSLLESGHVVQVAPGTGDMPSLYALARGYR
jgi:hypothetical protein